MPKKADDTVLDGTLDVIINNCNLMTLCEGEPTDRTDAITNKPTGKSLAQYTMAPGDFTKGDYAGGRQSTIAAQTGNNVDVTGDCDHVALVSATVLLAVTTTSAVQTLTAGNPVNVNSFTHQVADPT